MPGYRSQIPPIIRPDPLRHRRRARSFFSFPFPERADDPGRKLVSGFRFRGRPPWLTALSTLLVVPIGLQCLTSCAKHEIQVHAVPAPEASPVTVASVKKVPLDRTLP